MGGIRGAVNQFSIDVDTMASAYTNINIHLLDEVNANYRNAQDPESQEFDGGAFLSVERHRFLAQLRMRMHIAIIQKGFRGSEFAAFASLKGKYELNLEPVL